jgi:flavin reductase (DIM6/NTAB) family NADH-FMN oxidoreductase RutF
MGAFKKINCEELTENPFKLIGGDWMIITAGAPESYNLMTASWGGLGVLWQMNVGFCFVRPTRYTYNFMEKAGRYTLSFFSEEYRGVLNYCGTTSGRDSNKVAETGLKPVFDDGFICYEQARLVLQCRKLYYQDFTPDHFLEPKIGELYPQKDYHRMYVGEIVKCLQR